MYSIYLEEDNGTRRILYRDDQNEMSHKVGSPQLEMEVNRAGTLSFDIYSNNEYYSSVNDPLAEFIVERTYKGTTKEIWRGRLYTIEQGYYNNLHVETEGELAYLRDSVQEPKEYENTVPKDYAAALLNIHNKKMPPKKRFTLGRVTVTDDHSADKIVKRVNNGNYSVGYSNNTLDCLVDMAESLGGHLEIRKENGVRYLDILKDYENTCEQTIQFGRNLLDFTSTYSLSDFVTCLIPIGGTATTTDDEGNSVSTSITVASVNNNSVYVLSDQAVANYGRREASINFSGIINPTNLLAVAKKWLSDQQFDNMVLEINAVDAAYYSGSEEPLEFLYKVHAISVPHGMDKYFPISKVSLALDNPAQSTYTMSTTSRPVIRLSTAITDHDKETEDTIANLEDSLNEMKGQMTTIAAEQAGTPEDWLLGECFIFYPDDEVRYDYLTHSEYLESAFVANWDKFRIKGSRTEAGQTIATQNLTVGWKNALATEDDELWNSMTVEPINSEVRHSVWGRVGIDDYGGLYFPPGIRGFFPLNFERDATDAWVVYMVAVLYSDTAGGFGRRTNLSDGLENSLIPGNENTLRTVDGYTGLGTTIDYNGAPLPVGNKKLVYGLCYNVVDGEEHEAKHLIFADANGPFLPDASAEGSYRFDYGPSFGLNYYSGINLTDESLNHESSYVFIGVCHSSYGQITMDEVWDNMAGLVDNYINI